MNSDLNSPFQCVWEGSPSSGLGGFGGGVAQRTLFLGVDKELIWKTAFSCLTSYIVITSRKENDVREDHSRGDCVACSGQTPLAWGSKTGSCLSDWPWNSWDTRVRLEAVGLSFDLKVPPVCDCHCPIRCSLFHQNDQVWWRWRWGWKGGEEMVR